MAKCKFCGKNVSSKAIVCPSCGKPLISMIWHKIMLLLLLLGCCLNLITAVNMLHEGGMSVVFGILSAAVAVAQGIAFFWMGSMKKNALKLLYWLYGINAAIYLIPITFGGDIWNLIGLVLAIVLLYVNVNYYDKRRSLFIN